MSAYIYIIGFFAQALFSARILVQWIMSERAKRVVSPSIFWILSIIASYMLFIYGFLRDDFAIMLGQVISYYVYIWNLNEKEIWKKIPFIFRLIIIATPVAGVTYILSDFSRFTEQCLNNAEIPSLLVIYGSLGQIIFTLRFVYQFLYSKRHHASFLPSGFWIISLVGSAIIVSYGIFRLDPILILGQSFGFISYIRNLMLLYKGGSNRKRK